MKTPKIQVSSHSSPSNTAQNSKGTFLGKCVEQLNLKEANWLQRKATMWTVAAQIAPWAFAIAAIGSFVVTGIFAASYLPVAGVAVLLFLEPVYNFCNNIDQFSKEPRTQANMLKEVKQIHDKLTTRNPLNPLFARLTFWKRESERLSKLSGEMAKAASELIEKPDKKIPVSPSAYRKHSLQLAQESLIAKMNAAFIQAVIRQPKFSGNDSNIFTINDLQYDERALKHAFHDSDADVLVKFKRQAAASSRTLTSQQIARTSINSLSAMFRVA